jgi:hypothetical protein
MTTRRAGTRRPPSAGCPHSPVGVPIVFNSIMNLVTQDEQVRCVANAARHLADDGVFVVENVVPDPMSALRPDHEDIDQYVEAGGIGPRGAASRPDGSTAQPTCTRRAACT